MLGSSEIIVIAIVVLVLFGASAIPKFAKSLGEAKKEFDKASKDTKEVNDKKDSKDTNKDDKEENKNNNS